MNIESKYRTPVVKHEVYLVVLLSAIFQGAISLYSLYLSRKGVSDYDISIHYSILGLGGFLGAITGGFLGEYFTIRKVFCVFILTLIVAVLGLIYNTWMIFSFFIGLGIATNHSNILNYFSVIQSKKIAELALSWRRFALNLGVAFGAWIAGFILKFDSLYFISLCCIVLIIDFLFSLILPSNPSRAEKTTEKTQKKEGGLFWMMCATFVLALFPLSLLENLYLLHIKNEIGLNEKVAGTVFLINGLTIVLLQVPVIQLLQEVKTKWKCFLGILLVGFGISVIAMTKNEFQVYCGVLVWTLGEIVLFVPFLQSFFKNTPFPKARTIGVYQLCLHFSKFIYPLIASQIILISNVYLWISVASISLVASILSLKFIK